MPSFPMRAVRAVQVRVHRNLFDRWLDRRDGVETRGFHRPHELSLHGPNAQHAIGYEPTPKHLLLRLIGGLAIDPAEFIFVDLGCGKGRTLLVAAQLGFRRLEGVELADELYRTATRNVAQCKARDARILVHHLDAAEYRFPRFPMVVYLFNPFGGALVHKLVERLEASLAEAPRRCYVIYLNPEHAAAFDRSAFFRPAPRSWYRRVLDRMISPWPIRVYEARIPSAAEQGKSERTGAAAAA